MTHERIRLGEAAEKKAARFLEAKGYRILQRNFRWRHGEIDLVALDGDCVVFVEVKYRSGRAFGWPQEAVGGRKRARLQRGAMEYLWQRGLIDVVPIRFDVVAVGGTGDGCTIEHIENAF